MFQEVKDILREELCMGPMQTVEKRLYDRLEKYLNDTHSKMYRVIRAAQRIQHCCIGCTICASCEMAAALKEPKGD